MDKKQKDEELMKTIRDKMKEKDEAKGQVKSEKHEGNTPAESPKEVFDGLDKIDEALESNETVSKETAEESEVKQFQQPPQQFTKPVYADQHGTSLGFGYNPNKK